MTRMEVVRDEEQDYWRDCLMNKEREGSRMRRREEESEGGINSGIDG